MPGAAPSPRYGHGLTAAGGRLFVFGGVDGLGVNSGEGGGGLNLRSILCDDGTMLADRVRALRHMPS